MKCNIMMSLISITWEISIIVKLSNHNPWSNLIEYMVQPSRFHVDDCRITNIHEGGILLDCTFTKSIREIPTLLNMMYFLGCAFSYIKYTSCNIM